MASILLLIMTNLMRSIQIQMRLFKKQQTFSDLFSAFLEFRLNFKHFEKKMILIAYVFRKLQTAKYVARQISKKSRLKRRFSKGHGKRSQILFKSEDQHLYHNY